MSQFQAINVFLMRGSLHEMEVKQARAGAVARYKRRLQAHKSLSKGGSIVASEEERGRTITYERQRLLLSY
jgi:hypothetical protein